MSNVSDKGGKMKKFFHDKFGWVFGKTLKDVDPRGFQNSYTCDICKGTVLPSSGGYFHASE